MNLSVTLKAMLLPKAPHRSGSAGDPVFTAHPADVGLAERAVHSESLLLPADIAFVDDYISGDGHLMRILRYNSVALQGRRQLSPTFD